MRVLQINTSSHGGAGVAASVLNEELNNLGVESVFSSLMSTGLRDSPLENPLLTIAAAADEFLVKQPSVETQVSLFRSQQSRVQKAELQGFDVLHLHWVEGYLNSRDISKIASGKQAMVWSLHDMKPFTGGCHHAGECEGYQNSCKSCPQVRGPFKKAVELSLSRSRESLKSPDSKIVFTAPSEWMASRARKSSLLAAREVVVIPNPIDANYLIATPRARARASLGIDGTAHVVTLVAKNLGDPNKQVQNVVDQFKIFAKFSSEPSVLILVGDGGAQISADKSILKVGSLSAPSLRDVYCASDLVLSGSNAESFGLTLAEGAALGVPRLSTLRNAGGDGIVDGQNGFTVESVSDISSKLERVFRLSKDSLNQIGERGKSEVLGKSHPRIVAEAYKSLYENLVH